MAKQLQGESEQSREARLFIFFLVNQGAPYFPNIPECIACSHIHHSEKKNISGTDYVLNFWLRACRFIAFNLVKWVVCSTAIGFTFVYGTNEKYNVDNIADKH